MNKNQKNKIEKKYFKTLSGKEKEMMELLMEEVYEMGRKSKKLKGGIKNE